MLLGSLLSSSEARAHDFWIEPATYRPEVGSLLPVTLRVGQEFQGESVPRDEEHIVRFVIAGPREETPVAGRDGADPAGVARVLEPGWLVLGYRSAPSPIELEAVKFETYLRDEGLDEVLAARAKRGDGAKPGREIFSRCAKSLVLARGGEPQASGAIGSKDDSSHNRLSATGKSAAHNQSRFQDDSQTTSEHSAARVRSAAKEAVNAKSPRGFRGVDSFARVLGLTLELVPEADPATAERSRFPIRLLYEGRPLAGALVVARNSATPAEKISLRTDKKGRVELDLAKPGIWMVKAVHMHQAPSGSGADLESFWASLSFEAAP